MERSTNSNIAYLRACRHSPIISSDQDRKVLTKTVLPFVYTIFSLLALSLVYTPLTVVGLAEYNATFVKDMVFVGRVAIDITKGTILSRNYHKDAEATDVSYHRSCSQLSLRLHLQWFVWIILEGIFPQSFRFRGCCLSPSPYYLHFHDTLWDLGARRGRWCPWLRLLLRSPFPSE